MNWNSKLEQWTHLFRKFKTHVTINKWHIIVCKDANTFIHATKGMWGLQVMHVAVSLLLFWTIHWWLWPVKVKKVPISSDSLTEFIPVSPVKLVQCSHIHVTIGRCLSKSFLYLSLFLIVSCGHVRTVLLNYIWCHCNECFKMILSYTSKGEGSLGGTDSWYSTSLYYKSGKNQ